jgi:hypothetical protein
MFHILKKESDTVQRSFYGAYQWYYDLAIRMCLEFIRDLQLLTQRSVIVYLAIDGKR